jgi:hypothetical protein
LSSLQEAFFSTLLGFNDDFATFGR